MKKIKKGGTWAKTSCSCRVHMRESWSHMLPKMKNNFTTKIISVLLLSSILISVLPTTSVLALENNSELNESYTYTPYHYPVNSPMAYTFEHIISNTDIAVESTLSPMDVFATDDFLYVACGKTNAIYIFDKEYQLVSTVDKIKGELRGPDTLNIPEGIFIDENEKIYIADTGNQRIIVTDKTGTLINEFSDPQISVMGEVVTFFPSKIVADKMGRMYVIGKNINRGIIELSNNGEFNTFIGAPKVKADFFDFAQRLIMTDQQIARMEKFMPTEYNNIVIDSAGFLYGTIGSVDEQAMMDAAKGSSDEAPDNAKPVVKLSPAGNDILFRRGNVPVIGELSFSHGQHSFINDVAVRKDGIYSILDQRSGRVFSYDMYGNLLYVFGSLGRQNGRFSSPTGLCYFDDELIVIDQTSGKINIFKATEYGNKLNQAVKFDYDGNFDEAALLWKDLAQMNSNLFLAYTGIGKMYYREKDYETAMVYYKAGYDYYYYDQSKEKLRKEMLTEYFPLIAVSLILVAGAAVTFSIIKKIKRKGEDD